MFPSVRGSLAEVLGILVVLGALVPGACGQADVQGQWSTLPYLMPTNAVHAELLYNGKVLIIAGSKRTDGTPSKEAALWDPQAGTTPTTQSTSWYMFCNGMVALADGRVLVDGGTIQSNPFLGSQQAAIYDPAANTFNNTQSMAHGRWYPTVTMLSDGRIMTFSGLNETTGATNNAVEFYTVGSGWSAQYMASWTPPLYPRMHLLPSGNVFFSGSTSPSRLFNPTTKAWTTVANTNLGSTRTYGSSVLLALTPANGYRPKVMLLGGGVPTATATTELIDLGASNPAWQWGPDMSQARVEMDAVLLPTGKVLALAGSSTDEDAATASLNADLYDPDTNSFSSAGKNAYPRMYHTVSLLMPDATVWLAGSNPSTGVYEQHMEIYKPAYLFTRDANNNVVPATRPTITSAPGNINWNTQFSVSTPDAADIATAVLMRLGSSTHAFDLEARLVGLNFTPGSGMLTVTGPPNANIAPPGYYMLFLLNSQGVPSVAKILLLSGSGSPPPPPPQGFVQSNSGPSTIQASNTTVAVSYGVAETAGDLNIVVVGWGDTSSTISAVTDNRGNGYSLAVGPTSGTGLRQSIYYAKSIAGGSTTVTVTFNKAAAYPDVRILEYSGLDASAPLDQAVGAEGTGTTANSGTVSTTAASELIFGAGTSGSSFTGAGAGFTSRMINLYGNIAEDKTVASTGSYNATAADGSGVWVMQVATFRSSGQNPPPPPVPSSILPVSGTTAGGTAVTITGTGFAGGATVSFGGTAATGVSVGSSTTITATTPAHGAGAVNVVVTNSDGQSGTLTQGYTYTTPGNPAPTVSSITPGSGTTAGGTPVTITGTGFLVGATVSLGGTAATGVSVGSSTTITATTPAHGAGTVNVVVTNSDGQSGTLNNGYTYTSSSGGGIGFVQSNSGPSTIQASNTTVAVSYGAAEAAGDLNIVVVGWGDTSSTISAVTDNRGNGYSLAVGPTSGTGLRQSIYYAKSIAGGSTTVTVTFNKAAAYPDVRILEYSGLDASAPLDQAVGAGGTGTTANSGTVSTTAASELIFGAGTSGTKFTGAGTGFSSRMINIYGNIAEDKTVSATGSYNATAADSSGVWVMQVVTLKGKLN